MHTADSCTWLPSPFTSGRSFVTSGLRPYFVLTKRSVAALLLAHSNRQCMDIGAKECKRSAVWKRRRSHRQATILARNNLKAIGVPLANIMWRGTLLVSNPSTHAILSTSQKGGALPSKQLEVQFMMIAPSQ